MINPLRSFSRRDLMLYFAALACATTTTATVLANANILPAEQTSQGVTYLTGGIGLEESQAIKAAMPHYPLVVEVYHNAGGKNEYTASSVMTVSTPQGKAVFKATLEGPFALVRIQPGRYEVKVEMDGQARENRVEVKEGASARAVFVFKG